jgi:hypothetical protein
MQEKIQTLFSPLLAQLPKILGEEDLIFDHHNLPILDNVSFDTTQIAVKKSWHSYDNYYKIEHFHLSAKPEYYQILGLVILCAVFQQKQVTIHLTNPHSYIKKLVIGFDEDRNAVGLTEKPVRYHHYANEIRGRHPYNGMDNSYFPSIFLTSDTDCYTDADWAERNILLFGQTNKALAHLAEIFLDFGNPNNQQDELVFEGHAGYSCLQPMSVEMRFWLPDSLGWFDAAFL